MASVSLQAHHSLAGVYDMKAEKEVSGTLTKIQFVNPPGSMTIAVKNADGSTTDWVFTTGSATTLAERGIGKTSNVLKAGDKFGPAFILRSLALTPGTHLGVYQIIAPIGEDQEPLAQSCVSPPDRPES
jgi:hypothetical protein